MGHGRDRCTAFAPGRVNLIGEHTDYNGGLSLPFAIEEGVRVHAARREGEEIVARADGPNEEDRFPLSDPDPGAHEGWRAFVRGVVFELAQAGHRGPGAELCIEGTVPQGAGLSSSAALEVALCLALLGLAGEDPADRVALAELCSRVENRWVGARTGLLDQLASLLGRRGYALRIDFRSLDVRPVPLSLGEWRLVILDSGTTHDLSAAEGYNARRKECDHARALLDLESLRDARTEDAARLPEPLDRRVRHVLEENARVDAAVTALERGRLVDVGPLLDASHAGLRDLYEASTPAVERTVARLRDAGATGARMVGGGFGGNVLALFPAGVTPPGDARGVGPSDGAHILDVGGS